jgi:hypothetical protein
MPKLVRPKEKSWNWRKPSAPFPQTPGANGCFLAPSGGGKTTTLVSLLLGPYAKVFEAVHVFSPSVDIDSAWDPVLRQGAEGELVSFGVGRARSTRDPVEAEGGG